MYVDLCSLNEWLVDLMVLGTLTVSGAPTLSGKTRWAPPFLFKKSKVFKFLPFLFSHFCLMCWKRIPCDALLTCTQKKKPENSLLSCQKGCQIAVVWRERVLTTQDDFWIPYHESPFKVHTYRRLFHVHVLVSQHHIWVADRHCRWSPWWQSCEVQWDWLSISLYANSDCNESWMLEGARKEAIELNFNFRFFKPL